MGNKLIYQLGKKLIFHASYHEMREILEDYTQFDAESSITEKPKDIIKSLYESGHRAMMSYAILGVFCISNLWLFTYIDSHRHLPFCLQYAIPFFLSILFPFIIFVTIGKKIMLLSSLYLGMNNGKIGNIFVHVINIFVCLAIPIFYCTKSYNSVNVHFVQSIFISIATVGIIIFGYFVLTKGITYYLGLCSFYIMFCTLFQVKAIGSQLSSIEVYSRNVEITLVFYFVAILLSIVWFNILKKERF